MSVDTLVIQIMIVVAVFLKGKGCCGGIADPSACPVRGVLLSALPVYQDPETVSYDGLFNSVQLVDHGDSCGVIEGDRAAPESLLSGLASVLTVAVDDDVLGVLYK